MVYHVVYHSVYMFVYLVIALNFLSISRVIEGGGGVSGLRHRSAKRSISSSATKMKIRGF